MPQMAGKSPEIRDIGRAELGAETYSSSFNLDGRPAAGIQISLLPDANAIAVADKVHAKIEEARQELPGRSYLCCALRHYEIRESRDQRGLPDAHRSRRSGADRHSRLPAGLAGDARSGDDRPGDNHRRLRCDGGTWALRHLSTLFAIVLAIGIVVDDAIVIVEGSRYVEQGVPGREAAGRAMDDLMGPVIGITLVLMSVFIPAAFLPGLTGQIFRQFALVIAATAFISAINAVTLKPTQSALWLRPPTPGARRNLFSRGFNVVFGATERAYVRLVGAMTRRSGAMASALFWSVSRSGD